jgi:hypothetical protein
MGKPVTVPEPIYDRISELAERQDVPRGVIVRDWKEKAEKFEQMEAQR